MLKILLALVITLQIIIIPQILFLLYLCIESGGSFNILLPGLGLIVSGLACLLLSIFLEAFLAIVTVFLFCIVRRNSNKLS